MTTLLEDLTARCAAPNPSNRPKHIRLTAALQAAIENDILRPGDRLPTEAEITAAVPFALGTVQKSLNALVAQGILRRSRRTGTFVLDAARPLDDMSHFVFETSEAVPVETVRTRISEIAAAKNAPAAALKLGAGDAGLVRIARIDTLDDRTHCFTEIFLRADTFGALLETAPNDLAGRNIRTVLAQKFGVQVARMDYSAGIAPCPPAAAATCGVSAGDQLMTFEATGYAPDGKALFVQTLFVPPTGHRIRLVGAGA